MALAPAGCPSPIVTYFCTAALRQRGSCQIRFMVYNVTGRSKHARHPPSTAMRGRIQGGKGNLSS